MAAPEPIQTSNRLLAVIDDPADAEAVARRLTEAGIDADAITMLAGPDDAMRLSRRPTAWSRAMRFISFIAADQAVDLDWYQAALETGRAVLVVATRGAEHRRAAVETLRRSGAHFVNHYGRMATEDVIPWRGDPPPVHWIHHR
jgi:hypothetical protein